MIAIVLLIGTFLITWQITRASDYLPRYVVGDLPENLASPTTRPAIISWIASRSQSNSHPYTTLHAIFEIVCPVYIIMLWYTAESTLQFLVFAGLFFFFVLASLIDIKYRLILNVMVYPAIVLAIAGHIAFGHALQPILVGGFFAFMIFYGTYLIKPGGMGAGDVKLALLAGMCFGFPSILWVLIAGTGFAAITAITLMTFSNKVKTIPYAPFIAFGVSVVLLLSPIL